MAVRRGGSSGGRRSGSKSEPKPITEEVYVVKSNVVEVGNGQFVGLEDDGGTQYSVWDNKGNEDAFDTAQEAEGCVCKLTYVINKQYRNVSEVEILEEVDKPVTRSGASGGGVDSPDKQNSIEAQACMKSAIAAVTENPDLFFDDLENLTQPELVSTVEELALDLAEILDKTKSFLSGEDIGRPVVEEEGSYEPETERGDTIPEDGGYEEEEVKPKATPRKRGPVKRGK